MSTTASATPFLDPIQQQIQQHELLKQLNIMNKELKLLRTQPANTNTSVPLQNVTNLLGVVATINVYHKCATINVNKCRNRKIV